MLEDACCGKKKKCYSVFRDHRSASRKQNDCLLGYQLYSAFFLKPGGIGVDYHLPKRNSEKILNDDDVWWNINEKKAFEH